MLAPAICTDKASDGRHARQHVAVVQAQAFAVTYGDKQQTEFVSITVRLFV